MRWNLDFDRRIPLKESNFGIVRMENYQICFLKKSFWRYFFFKRHYSGFLCFRLLAPILRNVILWLMSGGESGCAYWWRFWSSEDCVGLMHADVVAFVLQMDRASILGDAIDYLKELLQRINDLHNELETTPAGSLPPSTSTSFQPLTPTLPTLPCRVKEELYPGSLPSPKNQNAKVIFLFI